MTTKTPKSSALKIHLAQLNFIVGDLDGNLQKIIQQYLEAAKNHCDLAVFSEMAICGYPCEDLWLNASFIEECKNNIIELIKLSTKHKCAILLGSPLVVSERKKNVLRNSALLIENGEIKNVIYKKSLPNYGVFDENRYFTPSPNLSIVEFKGFELAILICEDLWDERNLFLLKEQIINAVIIINASPFESNKHQKRLDLAKKYYENLVKPIIYLNQVGGQDSLVFDGASFIFNNNENILQLANFDEDYAQITINNDLSININNHPKTNQFITENIAQIYNAVTLSLRDYIYKNNFNQVIIGLSGGIDSALVAAIAVDAIGYDHVRLIALPTQYNSLASLNDAQLCANNLEIKLEIIAIEEIFQKNLEILKSHQTMSSLAEENLQSRIRGNILMAISNSTNALLLSTGNKSELATGYATIYGDMNGAFNPLKDLYKTQIYELANYRNNNSPKISHFTKTNLIPQNILNKEPSAELRFGQKDSDSLPPYSQLDKILYHLIENKKSVNDTINQGFDSDLVKKIAKLIHHSEYKRKQAVIGCKISNLSFDKDRRFPLTNKFIF